MWSRITRGWHGAVSRSSLLLLAALVGETSTFVHARAPEVKISSRIAIPNSSHGKFAELVGGSLDEKHRIWSYLALVERQGKHVEVGPSFPGISFDVLAQVEGQHFWAIGTDTVEGHKSWVLLVLSHNSGRSWKVIDLHRVFQQAGRLAKERLYVGEILRIEFASSEEGVMELITEESGKHVVLKTSDGGIHWVIK